MANYQETTGTASLWRRCFRVIVDNPLGQAPSARFFEESVVALPTATMRSEAGAVAVEFDPDKMIMLRDPTTGLLTGAYVTQEHLYAALYSLYMQTALERDAAAPPA